MKKQSDFLIYLTLFGSMSTLLCCALPAMFILAGAGAVFASFASQNEWIIWVSERKAFLFTISFILLSISGLMLCINRNAPCPTDPKQAKVCKVLRKWNVGIYFVSLGIYLTSIFFAFIAPKIFF